MTNWTPIEGTDTTRPIWVILYVMVETEKPGIIRVFPDIHGWYETEDEALAVLHHFPKPCGYWVRKANRRALMKDPT